jgi:GTP-binding protein
MPHNESVSMGSVFLGSFVAGQSLPSRREPKVAFLGRSNVGKSSLINLLTRSQIARVSKTPGRTRLLNLFLVDDRMIFGDFPGYGFARVSKQERLQWEQLIDRFLTPDNFQYAVHIVDSRHPGLDMDLQLQDWLHRRGIPHVMVLNKIDKLNQKERAKADREARNAFPGQSLLFVSTVTKEGKRELEKILQNISEEQYQRIADASL